MSFGEYSSGEVEIARLQVPEISRVTEGTAFTEAERLPSTHQA